PPRADPMLRCAEGPAAIARAQVPSPPPATSRRSPGYAPRECAGRAGFGPAGRWRNPIARPTRLSVPVRHGTPGSSGGTMVQESPNLLQQPGELHRFGVEIITPSLARLVFVGGHRMGG